MSLYWNGELKQLNSHEANFILQIAHPVFQEPQTTYRLNGA